MNSPLEGIAFLARSDNRVVVLRSLVDADRSRRDLREELGIPRSTLARILGEFENRGLTVRDGQRYTSTPAADEIFAKFLPLLETEEAIRNLGEAVGWLPPPAHSLDVHHFRDAEVVTSRGDPPTEPYDYALDRIRTCDKFRVLASTSVPRYSSVIRDRTVDGEWDAEGVFGANLFERIGSEPERMAPWYDIAKAGEIWVHDGSVPINVFVVDGAVLICLGEAHEGGLRVHGLLESTDGAVLEWAQDLYEEYRARSEPFDRSRFSEP